MNRRTTMATVLLALVLATPAFSHDFWLVPHTFQLSPGSELVVSGQTSSDFPTSLSAVTVDRVADARLITARDTEVIEGLSVGGTSLLIRHRPTREGQAVVAVAIHPRSLPESPESFRRYLTLEGAPEALERYEREGLLPVDSITRRYAKYAKTLVEIGHGGERAFDRIAGHPLEFLPLDDPASHGNGTTLRFRLLFLGSPLANARGFASVAASSDATSSHHEVQFETNGEGELTVELSEGGLWNVRALHIVPAPVGSGADWDVHWATFVWKADG